MEVCVDSLCSAQNAFVGGANRIELCASLNEGGLTPSLGLFKAVRNFLREEETNTKNKDKGNEQEFKVHCMIRPRAGDFVYSESECETMSEDIKVFLEQEDKCDGLVFGALDAESGNVDEDMMSEFMKLCGKSNKKKTTFHRAFDVSADWRFSFEKICSLGFDSLLTSGQEATAWQGRELIAKLVKLSTSSNLTVMCGSGVNVTNCVELLDATKCVEFHSSCSSVFSSKKKIKTSSTTISMGSNDELTVKFTDTDKVKKLADIFKVVKERREHQATTTH